MKDEFVKIKKQLPVLGTGLGLRRELVDDTFDNAARIDWLEIVPENYMGLGGRARERLEEAASSFPLVSHGVNLSIGSTDDLSETYLSQITELLDRINSPWWSDHLCFTSHGGTYMHDLLPVPLTREAVHHIAERAKRVQDRTGRPFLLENISFYMQMPGSQMPEEDFITNVIEEADCGLLLDVNNVYVNSLNHKFDPYKYIDNLPLDRVVQIHIAGHKKIDDYVIDTHGAAVVEPVFKLLEHVLRKAKVNAILLERDQQFPEFDELLGEVAAIKDIVLRAQPELNVSHKTALSGPPGKNQKQSASWSEGKGGRDVRALSA
jgi:uncharacterized protein (UPF0276 family)